MSLHLSVIRQIRPSELAFDKLERSVSRLKMQASGFHIKNNQNKLLAGLLDVKKALREFEEKVHGELNDDQVG